jgi:signal transduction histidine kinase
MQRMCEAKGIKYHYQENGKTRILNPQLKNTVYRIATEAIENAIKHAVANNIWVTVTFNDDSLLLQVKDDGVGFSSDKLHTKETIGVPYMYQRAKFLKGELNIESIPGAGCKVTLNCPC